MTRFTDEQLSRILGEHAAGNMRRSGGFAWRSPVTGEYPFCCAVQPAENIDSPREAYYMAKATTEAFDSGYNRRMTPEQLLVILEPQ